MQVIEFAGEFGTPTLQVLLLGTQLVQEGDEVLLGESLKGIGTLGAYLCCQGETEDHKDDEYDDVQAARQGEEGFPCACPGSGSCVGLAVSGVLVGGSIRFERGLSAIL